MFDRVFVIAEAGVNHDGVLADALTMIDVAADAGADAVKFQTFMAGDLLTPRAMKAAYQAVNTGSDGAQMEMIRALEVSRADHLVLAERCRARGIAFMSTAFDIDSLDFLAGFDMPAIKIGSGDLTWGPMLLRAARMGRPLFISTGMATLDEVGQALAVVAFGLTRTGEPAGMAEMEAALASPEGRAAVAERVVLLHCTTQYPAPVEVVNLRAMAAMAERFGVRVGYSDHTLGTTVALAAAALGARVIEKHFTLSRSRPGPDHAASLEPGELADMVRAVRAVEAALGDGIKAPAAVELPNRLVARRSLVAARDIAAGEPLTGANVTAKRPADGMSPMDWWSIRGRTTRRAYVRDEALDAEEAGS